MSGELIIGGPDNSPLAQQPAADPTPLALIAEMVRAGSLTQDSAAAIEKLCALQEHMQNRSAEREFAVAFAELQAELPSFSATSGVPDAKGNIKWRYLKYEDLKPTVNPLLEKHGFSTSYSAEPIGDKMCVICTLQHRGGHHREYRAFGRAGSGPPGCTPTQADGATISILKRYALELALDITIDHRNDARVEGTTITFEQSENIRQLLYLTKTDEADEKFMKFSGAATVDDITTGRYDDVISALERKKARQSGVSA